MQVEFLAPGDARWAETLAGSPHDVYAVPGYVDLASREEGGEPVAVLVGEGGARLLIPLTLRPNPEPGGTEPPRDAASPYGYPGIVTGPGDTVSPAFVTAAMTAALDALRERGVVSLFLRLHPLYPFDTGLLDRLGTLVLHGRTVSVDLTVPGDLFPDLRYDHRKNLRRLDRLGYTCTFHGADDQAAIAAFVDVYTETMGRLDASESYYFGVDYVHGLAAALDGQITIALARDAEGDLAAVGLFIGDAGLIQHHLGGTRSTHFKLAPSKLIVREAARRFREQGNHTFHMGGGLGGAEDALFYFKSGFTLRRHPFHTARIVVDPDRFDRLTSAWSRRSGQPADLAGFFPPYRQPVAHVDAEPVASPPAADEPGPPRTAGSGRSSATG